MVREETDKIYSLGSHKNKHKLVYLFSKGTKLSVKLMLEIRKKKSGEKKINQGKSNI